MTSPDMQDEAPLRFVEAYKAAMRHIVSPVAVVTFPHGPGRGGLTCTAICSASTAPPALVVCINNDTPACAAMIAAGAFAVNFLTDEQSEIARQFSQSAETEDAFQVGTWRTGLTGAPLLEDTAASLECRIEMVKEHGSHTVFIGTVAGLETSDGSGLLYRDGYFRRLAAE